MASWPTWTTGELRDAANDDRREIDCPLDHAVPVKGPAPEAMPEAAWR